MEAIPEELKDGQYYIELLDALIEENDMELKHRSQKADTYRRFVKEHAGILLDKTIDHIDEHGSSFPKTVSMVLDQWKKKMFG